jgi:hypothetical protein
MKKTIATEIKITFYIVLISAIIAGIGYLTISQVSKPTYISDENVKKIDSIYAITSYRISEGKECEDCRREKDPSMRYERERRWLSSKVLEYTCCENIENKEGLLAIDYSDLYYEVSFEFRRYESKLIIPSSLNYELKNRFETVLKERTFFLFIISLIGLVISRYLYLGVLWVIKHSK